VEVVPAGEWDFSTLEQDKILISQKRDSWVFLETETAFKKKSLNIENACF
jgi:hypothetical protein